MKSEVDPSQIDRLLRWRLVLGRYSHAHLTEPQEDGDREGRVHESQAMEKTLDFLYDREFAQRAHRRGGAGSGSGLTIPAWLSTVRQLFPRTAAEVMERDALHRYGMTELVTDPEVLARAEPTTDLLKAIVQFKHLMKGPVLKVARERVAEVVESIRAQLEVDCSPALYGPRKPLNRPPVRSFRNVDWVRTVRRNLKNWDQHEERLLADQVVYRHRSHDRSRWRIIVSVDQSGSMTDSLLHSAVMAAIFAKLPAVQVNLVLWDHRILDVSESVEDPLEVLMNVQLGGGTDFLPALEYCSALVEEPARTILVVLSDFHVWGDRDKIFELAGDLTGAGVKAVGLCALDTDGHAAHDERFAGELADRGWFVASLTPRRLAEHIGAIIA